MAANVKYATYSTAGINVQTSGNIGIYYITIVINKIIVIYAANTIKAFY